MAGLSAEASGVGGFLRRVFRRTERARPVEAFFPLSVLEEIQAGKTRDYCLYLQPTVARGAGAAPVGALDVESMVIRAFAPLAVLPLDETGSAALPEESFLTLAEAARVLWLAPTDDAVFLSRLRLLKDKGPLNRCIFHMPDVEGMGRSDWPATWAAARGAALEFGIELSAYTGGGWLFRIGPEGKACTFRPIVNPNPEKIAKALEAICTEME